MYHKRNFGMMPQSFGGLLEGFLENGMPKVKGDFWYTSSAPVNIKETDKAYELQLVAPGLKKDDFKINLDQDILTISFEQKEETKDESEKWLRNEYHFRSFKRSFTLNEKVNAAGITAKYEDGILNVSLPKKETEEKVAQQITVA
jgi:HSP20 family protein